ncbi:mucin-5AC-like [Hyalella azteca]|uniref:Mucin-5AC-like n=1 Tax=Hyalella azteca TaxID=294128 RepID=A0A979FY73_HYAAZ|nr:mucin-5AC-like [Hyalella azteca]
MVVTALLSTGQSGAGFLRYETRRVPAHSVVETSSLWYVPSVTVCALRAAGLKASVFSHQQSLCQILAWNSTNTTTNASSGGDTREVLIFTGDEADLHAFQSDVVPATTAATTTSTAATTTTIAATSAATAATTFLTPASLLPLRQPPPPPATTTTTATTPACPSPFVLSSAGCLAVTTTTSAGSAIDAACSALGGVPVYKNSSYSAFLQLVQALVDQGVPSAQLYVGAQCINVVCGWTKNYNLIQDVYPASNNFFPADQPKALTSTITCLVLNMDPAGAYYKQLSTVECTTVARVVCMK